MKSNEINYSWSQLHNIILVVMVVTSLRRYTPCLRLFLNTLEFYAATKKVHLPLSERHTLIPTGNSRHGAGNDLAPVFLLFMYCYRTSTMARGVEYPCLLHLLNISTSPFIYFMPNDTRPCTWPAHLLPVFFS